MAVALFDEFDRSDPRPGLQSEPQFAFLSRTSRSGADRIREACEVWFARYPDRRQPDLRARFRSPMDAVHLGATFELILHEMLLRLGCTLELEPDLPNGSRRHPDFRVTDPCGARFYLEATVVTAMTPDEEKAKARVNKVYEAIDRINSPNFFLGVDAEGSPATPVPSRRMRDDVRRRLARLDPEVLVADYQAGGEAALPHWEFSHDGWTISFWPIPKSPDARGKPGLRPLGLIADGVRWVQAAQHLRDSLLDKAGAYGELDLPYVIAVNVLDHIDYLDVFDALFGDDVVTVSVGPGGARAVPTRTPNGAWTSAGGPRYARVSAVLVTSYLDSISAGHAPLELWHNPWSSPPFDSVLTRLPQYVPADGRMERRGGRSLGDILGLAAGWPFPEVSS